MTTSLFMPAFPRQCLRPLVWLAMSAWTTAALAAPVITSFAPTSGPVGTVIVVHGTGLAGTANAWIGAAHDATIVNYSANEVHITVPATRRPVLTSWRWEPPRAGRSPHNSLLSPIKARQWSPALRRRMAVSAL